MKVLIIDDEIVIRNGMANVLPWKDHGYTILEPASSGEEAIVRIEKERPDIIISDIKMHGMSGLELVALVADLTYPKEVIILSGYDEFNYVQEAMKHNVSDYLLKTSAPEEILSSVNKARERLIETQHYLALEETGTEQRINSTCKRLLYNALSLEEIATLQRELPDLKGKAFQIIVINKTVDEQLFYQYRDLWNTYLYGRWLTHNGRTLIITKREPDLSDHYLLKMAAKKVNEIFEEPLNVSKVMTHLNDLSIAYEEAISLLFYKWLLPDNVTIGAMDIKGRKGISQVDQFKEFEGELLECIRYGDEMGLETWVRRFVSWAFIHPMATPKSIENYVQNLYFSVVQYVDQIGMKTKIDYKRPPVDAYLSQPVKMLQGLFSKLLLNVKNTQQGANQYITNATNYMESRLSEGISLQDVADHVHVHPNYLSEMFRKVTGKSYLELLTEKRLERAEDYLINSKIGVGEITNLIGYSDRKHFTKLFKRRYDMTPSEFRKQKLQGRR